ncbi:transcription elongation factor [Acidianus hospitalis]|uniref:Transcription elongation factor n=1 Tax=Acidianus hospitalis TaxID=563177 RepID=A0A2T9X225_9CREN|nr:transcription elongation factor [Acidianus hospitalis]
MGGKRKKRTKIIKPKPKLPKTFECPRCGRIAISVEIKNGIARIKCGNCGLSADIEVPPVFDEANAYGKFIDLYLDGKLEIKESNKEESTNEGEDKQVHTTT